MLDPCLGPLSARSSPNYPTQQRPVHGDTQPPPLRHGAHLRLSLNSPWLRVLRVAPAPGGTGCSINQMHPCPHHKLAGRAGGGPQAAEQGRCCVTERPEVPGALGVHGGRFPGDDASSPLALLGRPSPQPGPCIASSHPVALVASSSLRFPSGTCSRLLGSPCSSLPRPR